MSQLSKNVQKFHDELCLKTDGLILKGGQIVIPASMRPEILTCQSLGITKTKERAKEVGHELSKRRHYVTPAKSINFQIQRSPDISLQGPGKLWPHDCLLIVDYFWLTKLAKLSETKS